MGTPHNGHFLKMDFYALANIHVFWVTIEDAGNKAYVSLFVQRDECDDVGHGQVGKPLLVVKVKLKVEPQFDTG